MDVRTAIETRRAYRSLAPVTITEELITDLATCAQLSASCYNKQPWRYVFIYEPEALKSMHEALSKGNEWAYNASMIIAVFSHKDLDCLTEGREYFLFDTGMATAFLILRATELGLVAHPIAGFKAGKVKEILRIPEDMYVITLVICGKHANTIQPELSEKQAEAEMTRPDRKPLTEFVYHQTVK